LQLENFILSFLLGLIELKDEIGENTYGLK